MKLNRLYGSIILLITSIIWGFAFVAQRKISQDIGAFTLNGIRCIIGAIMLIPLIVFLSYKNKKPIFESCSKDRKKLIFVSILSGIALFIGMNFQQFGIAMYPEDLAASGRSGFITSLYIVLVPIFSLFLKKKIRVNSIFSIIIATIGLYFLCFSNGLDRLYIGDLIVLLSSIGFAIQIIIIDKFSSSVDAIKLSFLQFIVSGVLSFILMLIFDEVNFSLIIKNILPLLYLGIVSSGIGYTLQIVGQKISNNPTVDSIIMSLESVFALIGGVIILSEKLLINEIIGCIVMFLAVIIAQLPNIKLKKAKN